MSDIIANLRVQLTSIKLAEKRIILLDHQLDDAQHDLEALRLMVDKEYHDVQKLEKIASGILYKKFLGNIDKNLEKEREEYLHAVLKYDNLANKIKILQYEKDILTHKISTKETLYDELESVIKQSAFTEDITAKHPLYDAIQKFDVQVQKFEQLKVEIDEALIAATNLKNYLIIAGKNLSGFDKLSNNGFQILYYEQVNYLKNIRQVFAMIDHLEQQLNKELKDINDNVQSKNLYTPFINFFETMFNVAVIGWQSSTHLRRSKECIHQNIKNTEDIIKYLQNLLLDMDKKLASIQQEKNMYLENI
jgi:hypothetical protein